MDILIEKTPQLVAGFLGLFLAGAVIAVRPRHRLHQALFLLLWLLSLERIVGGFITYDPNGLANRLIPYFLLATPMAAVFFSLQFWKAHGPKASRMPAWLMWTPLVLSAVLVLLVVVPAVKELQTRWEGVLVAFRFLAVASIGALSAWLAWKTPIGQHRRSLSLLAAAFVLEAAFRAPFFAALYFREWVGSAEEAITLALYLAATALVLTVAAALAVVLRRMALAATVMAALTTAPAFWLSVPVASPTFLAWMPWVVTASLFVLMIGMLAYALVHCRVFAIDLRLKSALRQSTVATVLTGFFLVLTEVIESNLPDGPLNGNATTAVASGVLVALAFQPVQMLATRLVDRLMPSVAHTPTYHERRAQQIYQAAIEDAIVDGRITESEENVLTGLQRQLGIQIREALRLERRVLEGRTIAEYRAI